jgi:hypothetical protein
MKCTRKICNNEAEYLHELNKTYYCKECAIEIQGYENSLPNPIKIFAEFFKESYYKNK